MEYSIAWCLYIPPSPHPPLPQTDILSTPLNIIFFFPHFFHPLCFSHTLRSHIFEQIYSLPLLLPRIFGLQIAYGLLYGFRRSYNCHISRIITQSKRLRGLFHYFIFFLLLRIFFFLFIFFILIVLLLFGINISSLFVYRETKWPIIFITITFIFV